jgi:hypothetical protein
VNLEGAGIYLKSSFFIFSNFADISAIMQMQASKHIAQ